ncbi:UDP-N-acetylmuramoylalanine--D-glutamate ligase [hydrothermal vent metagenome]|uniref:UDP-N-acetylmuramoylalanine--D-glutamate ligase n=1 Tax=hydrothermal vent metagenome TaxID=652676 RepID=A0A3B0UD17_9ZZZZ
MQPTENNAQNTKNPLDGPILLYGAGREAKSTRRFLKDIAPNTQVHVAVDNGPAELEDTLQVPVDGLSAAFAANKYSMLVRSPGVSIYKNEIQTAIATGVKVTTNVNLWARYKKNGAKTIAITGTKGKSTTAKLVHTMLEAAGFDAALAGNIGVPVLDLAPHQYVVLELSSFQCADLRLDPDFIGITPIFPEHLDWHRTEQQYFADKLNILRRRRPYHCALAPQVIAHSSLPQPPSDLVHALPELSCTFSQRLSEQVATSRLKGKHNLENAILAARLALGAGIDEQAVLDGIAVYLPLPHRLEEFHFSGKTFVDDSIATNPQATKAALATYDGKKLALIIGGFDRDQNFDDLSNHLMSCQLASIWFLPGTGHRIASNFMDKDLPFKTHKIASLKHIFEQLEADPSQFEILLLSPGAPSFNQFKNFEQRGEAFVELAKKHFG